MRRISVEFKIVRDKFLNDSDRLDKEHLERSALTASQLKRRIDQSRDNVKIIRKGQNSRDVSPLFLRNTTAAQERAGAKELKQLLEANARWNATRRDISDSELRRVVDETSTINPELRKELLYPWERGFIEDKQPTVTDNLSGSFLRTRTEKKLKSPNNTSKRESCIGDTIGSKNGCWCILSEERHSEIKTACTVQNRRFGEKEKPNRGRTKK